MKFFKKINSPILFEKESFLNLEEIEILLQNKINTQESLVIKNKIKNEIVTNIRTSQTSQININDSTLNIINKINNLVDEVNNTHWHFNIDCLGESSIVSYVKPKDNYVWHMDWGPDPISCNRKISIIIQLSEDTDYEGCRLQIKIGKYANHYFNTKKGSIIIFPSFLLHRATKLISGKREALVLWYYGDSFT